MTSEGLEGPERFPNMESSAIEDTEARQRIRWALGEIADDLTSPFLELSEIDYTIKKTPLVDCVPRTRNIKKEVEVTMTYEISH